MQLLAINKLHPNPKYKHVPHNLSSWNIPTELTHNLSHINVQSIKNNPRYSLSSVFKDICGSEDTCITPHIFSTWTTL